MAEIKLFIATTIDGFIAREDGSLDWLPGSDPNAPEAEGGSELNSNDGGYGEFISTIDIVVLGRKTYEEVLGFGVEWPYENCKSYVVSSDKNYETSTDNTFTLNHIDSDTINELKTESELNIWVVGGGQLITEFLNYDAVDEMTISVFPTILGTGIRLFPNKPKETSFTLVKTEQFDSGFVNLTYKK